MFLMSMSETWVTSGSGGSGVLARISRWTFIRVTQLQLKATFFLFYEVEDTSYSCTTHNLLP
jgi:hypothetical protein